VVCPRFSCGDHETLFWGFFVFLPLQYWLVGIQWYGLFAILIPVYGFLFLPVRSALAGDTQCFLERSAKIRIGATATSSSNIARALMIRSMTRS